jgi:hypothetical protein
MGHVRSGAHISSILKGSGYVERPFLVVGSSSERGC